MNGMNGRDPFRPEAIPGDKGVLCSTFIGRKPNFWTTIFIMLLMVTGMKAKAATLNVGPGQTYATIGAAIAAANPSGDDTILIEPGTYPELITVDRNLTIRSDPATTTASNPVILDGQNSGTVVSINGGIIAALLGLVIQNGTHGVLGGGYLAITDCLIQNNKNTGGGGGGILSASDSLMVSNTTFLGNSAYQGGAIDEESSTANYINCTFVNNTATFGGAIYAEIGSTLPFTNCTFINNSAAGGVSAILVADGIVEARNCIFSSSQSNCGNFSGATYTSLGHNLSTDGTCGGGPGDQINVADIQAGPLLDNAGSTPGYIPPTNALISGSPALDAGDSTGAPFTDERGQARDSHPDIGAFEANGAPAAVVPPTCGYTYVVSHSDVSEVQVTYQQTDPGDGIFSFDLLSNSNDSLTLQIGSGSANSPGVREQAIPLANRNDPQVLTSTKQTSGTPSTMEVSVEDFDGNYADCTAPIFTSIALRQSGGSYRQTFQNLTPEQGHVHLLNGDRGIDQLEAQVNGHDYMLASLTPDQSADLDLTSTMQEGNANEVTLIGTGPVGSQAFALIGNGTIVRTDGTSTPGAGLTAPVPWDLNGDGKVTVADAILLLKAVVGEQSLTARQRQAIGLVGSQPVTVADVVALLRKGVGE